MTFSFPSVLGAPDSESKFQVRIPEPASDSTCGSLGSRFQMQIPESDSGSTVRFLMHIPDAYSRFRPQVRFLPKQSCHPDPDLGFSAQVQILVSDSQSRFRLLPKRRHRSERVHVSFIRVHMGSEVSLCTHSQKGASHPPWACQRSRRKSCAFVG